MRPLTGIEFHRHREGAPCDFGRFAPVAANARLLCDVQTYVRALGAGDPLPHLDFEPRAVALPPSVELSPGDRIRVAGAGTLAGPRLLPYGEAMTLIRGDA